MAEGGAGRGAVSGAASEAGAPGVGGVEEVGGGGDGGVDDTCISSYLVEEDFYDL